MATSTSSPPRATLNNDNYLSISYQVAPGVFDPQPRELHAPIINEVTALVIDDIDGDSDVDIVATDIYFSVGTGDWTQCELVFPVLLSLSISA